MTTRFNIPPYPQLMKSITTFLTVLVLSSLIYGCAMIRPSSTGQTVLQSAGRAGARESYWPRDDAAASVNTQAVAVLVFPSVIKAGFLYGGQTGNGILFRNGVPSGCFNTSAISYGLQAGIQDYGYALFFMNEHALSYLNKSGGFELGAGPSVVVADEGLRRTIPRPPSPRMCMPSFSIKRASWRGWASRARRLPVYRHSSTRFMKSSRGPHFPWRRCWALALVAFLPGCVLLDLRKSGQEQQRHGAVALQVAGRTAGVPAYAIALNSGKVVASQSVPADGIAAFLLSIGKTYDIAVFSDRNRNRRFDTGEPSAWHEEPPRGALGRRMPWCGDPGHPAACESRSAARLVSAYRKRKGAGLDGRPSRRGRKPERSTLFREERLPRILAALRISDATRLGHLFSSALRSGKDSGAFRTTASTARRRTGNR